jgi:hypothetical protein
MTSTPNNSTSTEPRRRLQFSIRTLLWVTLATAIALAILVSSPSVVAVPVMMCLTIAIPAILTVVVIYGSGYQRTFCVGALFPTGIALYATGWLLGLSLFEPPSIDLDSLDGWLDFFDGIGSAYRAYTGCAWLLAIAVGSIAVAVRCRLQARARRDEKEA